MREGFHIPAYLLTGILKIVDKGQVQFFEWYILPAIGVRQELPDMLTDGTVSAERTLRTAVTYFLFELSVVLFKQF